MTTVNAPEFVRHPKLIAWVEEIANLTKPAKIEWCDGSEEEYQRLIDLMIANGTMQKLNQEKHPGSYLHLLAKERRCWCDKQLGRTSCYA